jgi:Uncharacterized protein conserved in bacteria (DUF2252)
MTAGGGSAVTIGGSVTMRISPGVLAPPDECPVRGRARWERVAPSEHAQWGQPRGLPDPVRILGEHAKTRVPDRVLTRYGRMLTSPFAGGKYRIRLDHPVIVRFPIERNPEMLDELRSAITHYKETLPADQRDVLYRHYFGDFALKVAGVGSVGTEAFVLLLSHRADEPLFLQLKEQKESVSRGQRMSQAATDDFLGWAKNTAADPNKGQDHYVRQLLDMKGTMDVPAMEPGQQLNYYGRLCRWALARGPARSGRATVITGYLGEGTQFDYAIADFALAHAEQNAKVYQCLIDAVANGRVQAVIGLSGANPQPRLTGPLLPRAFRQRTAGPGRPGPAVRAPRRLPDVAGQRHVCLADAVFSRPASRSGCSA